LLVLAVERRRSVLREMPARAWVGTVFVVLFLALAELLALVALVTPEYRGAWLEPFIAVAIGGLLALTVREALWPGRSNRDG
jgi:hypothetical protein